MLFLASKICVKEVSDRQNGFITKKLKKKTNLHTFLSKIFAKIETFDVQKCISYEK